MTSPRDVLASLRLADGSLWVDAAADWQLADLLAVIEGPEPYHFLTRARGASKTTDLAAAALALLLTARRAERLYWVASDQDQGVLAIDAIAGFASRTSGLFQEVDVQTRAAVAHGSGARLDVLAADAPGAWGLQPYAVFADELAQWADTPAPRRLWEAVSSAVAKSRETRLVVLTTAGDPAHFSAQVLEHAIRSPLWRVHEVHGPAPWADPERLAEQRARLTESAYARLFENRWTAADDRLTTIDAVRECVTHAEPLAYRRGRSYVVALDLGLKRDRTAAVVAHRDGPKVVLDRIAVWQGTRQKPVRLSAVETWLEKAVVDYGRAQIVADPWQAAGLCQRLRGRGFRVVERPFTAQSVGRFASTLYGLLRDGNLELLEDPELLDELAHVRLRETSPGVVRMDHDPGRHDDRAIALALAATELLDRPLPSPTRPRAIAVPGITGDLERALGRTPIEGDLLSAEL